jgi:VanZ family protein
MRQFLTALPVRILMPVLLYGLIFCLTEYPGASPSETEKGIQQIGDPKGWISETAPYLNTVFRTSAHFFLFGLLGVSLYFLFKANFSFKTNTFLVVMGLVAFLGFFDEVHQHFVPNRHPKITDIALDTLGAFVLVGTACLVAKKKSG